MTVVCVDDSATIRMLVKKTLEKNGYLVRDALDGQDALDKLNEDPDADLFIVDVNMPNMDGFTFVEEIKKDERFSSKPVIFLTTEAGAEKKQAGKELGVNGWMVKPFEEQSLLKIIQMFSTS